MPFNPKPEYITVSSDINVKDFFEYKEMYVTRPPYQRKSVWSKKKKQSLDARYCDNNADVDNYLKAILDSLNEVVYVDDRQIVEISARKIYSSKPCIKCKFKIIDKGEWWFYPQEMK